MNILRFLLTVLLLWACLSPCSVAGFSISVIETGEQNGFSRPAGRTEYLQGNPLTSPVRYDPDERFAGAAMIGDDELPNLLPSFQSSWYAASEELSHILARFSLKDVSAGTSLRGAAPSSLPVPVRNFAEFLVEPARLPALVPPKYGLPAERVRRMSAERHVVLVDVRTADAFERVSIPDSQNIPLFAVKTKTWLRSRSVILVDEGFRLGELNEACEQLQQLGFKVWFLLGGLTGWKVSGGTLEGDVFAQRSINRLSAEQWLTDSCKGCRLVVDASSAGSMRSMPDAQCVRLPFDPDTP